MVTKEQKNISQENSNKSEEKNNNKLNIILIIVIIIAIFSAILSTIIVIEACKMLKTKQETTNNLNIEENKTIIKEKEVSKIYMTDEKENEIITVEKPVENEIKPVVNTNPENTSEPSLANNYIKGILVVNKKYELPSDYNPGVNEEALQAFNDMKYQAKQEGISLTIVSGYRSYETQAAIFKKNVNLYGEEEANTFSARPGQSEHQTGLAFDINSTKWSFGDTKEAKWLAANCYKYGFIIRYPEGKEKITGYVYEPWHIRYVGIEPATEIYGLGICLEEYLDI